MNEHQEKIDALRKELEDIEAKIAAVPDLERRRRELRGGFHGIGEINQAVREKRDSQFPILSSCGWRKERIIEVDGKWIVTREDGAEDRDVTRYRRDNGWKERARKEWGAIDPVAAIKIWEEHQG